MPEEQLTRRCPACGGTQLCRGTLAPVPLAFRPGSWTFFQGDGYELHAWVCLDCGYVSVYLEVTDLIELGKLIQR